MNSSFVILLILLLSEVVLIQGGCLPLFNNIITIKKNDTDLREGDILEDLTPILNGSTIDFTSTPDPNSDCGVMITVVNGSIITLNYNPLTDCDHSSARCSFTCNPGGSKNDIQVDIERLYQAPLRFQNDTYSASVPESAHDGFTIFNFNKNGAKRNDCYLKETPIVYNLQTTFDGTFSMTSQGVVQLQKQVDYDGNRKSYDLKVLARHDVLSTSTTLRINVTDIDDMDPEFDSQIYELLVQENNNSAVSIPLTTNPPIKATDRDTGEGAQEVYYRFQNNRTIEGEFEIENITGKIILHSVFDREQKETYKLIIKAVQQNTFVRSCTATLVVRVLDENDNEPVFKPTAYDATVDEHSSRGTYITTVTASDKDKGENANFSYNLATYDQMFLIDMNGIIKVKNSQLLDRERPNGDNLTLINHRADSNQTCLLSTLNEGDSDERPISKGRNKKNRANRMGSIENLLYNHWIYAIDNKSGHLSENNATVQINLMDINDNTPHFLKPSYIFILTDIFQSFVGRVDAVDSDDKRHNGNITYDITPSSSLFDITEKTGNITLKSIITKDESITVRACDNPVNGDRRCNFTIVTIKPYHNGTVSSMTLNISFPENMAKGSSVKDLEIHGTSYKINGENGSFSIDQSGVLRSEEVFDREEEEYYSFTIQVLVNNEIKANITINVDIEDVNDNAPVFTSEEYVFELPLTTKPGQILGQVLARDRDKENTKNADILYQIQSSLSSNMFYINNKTGNITIINDNAGSTPDIVELTIKASDKGFPQLSSTAQVYLSKSTVVGNNVKISVPISEDDLKKTIETVENGIGNILHLMIKTEETKPIQTNPPAAFLTISARYQNKTEVNGSDLQREVLTHMREILALFSRQTSPMASAKENSVSTVVIALIVIAAILFIGSISLIIVIFHKTKRFERYKQLNEHLTRRSSLYESQELKIKIDDETSDYNGSLNTQELASLHNGNTAELQEGVASAFSNPVYTDEEETVLKMASSEEDVLTSLNELTDRLDAEDVNALPVDSYEPSHEDTSGEINPDHILTDDRKNDYENIQLRSENVSGEILPEHVGSVEEFPTIDEFQSDVTAVEDQGGDNRLLENGNANENTEEDEEPNPDYNVKEVRFSAQVLDTDENKFEPLKENENSPEDEGESSENNASESNGDDFGDGIECDRIDEEIVSPVDFLKPDNAEDEVPHFTFDTKL